MYSKCYIHNNPYTIGWLILKFCYLYQKRKEKEKKPTRLPTARIVCGDTRWRHEFSVKRGDFVFFLFIKQTIHHLPGSHYHNQFILNWWSEWVIGFGERKRLIQLKVQSISEYDFVNWFSLPFCVPFTIVEVPVSDVSAEQEKSRGLSFWQGL